MQITINNKLCRSLKEIRLHSSKETAEFIEEFLSDSHYIKAHTSGSTGTPKEIHLSKKNIKASAKLTNSFFNLNQDSTFYLNLSPSYIAGKMMIARALELEAKIIDEKPSNQPIANYNQNERISLGAFVPSQIKYLLNNPEKLAMFDNIIIGGGILPQKIEKRLAEQGIRAFRTYGMTETCSHVALAPVGTTPQPYTALGNITFSTDSRNCLIIHAPHFTQQEIQTNDVVDLLSPTQFHWCGRIDNVINTGGIKVFPEKIEPLIGEIIPHARFFITSVASDTWGEEVTLVLEYSSIPDGEIRKGDIQPALIEKMKQRLPSHAVPRRYIAVKKFKETTSGKIIRKI